MACGRALSRQLSGERPQMSRPELAATGRSGHARLAHDRGRRAANNGSTGATGRAMISRCREGMWGFLHIPSHAQHDMRGVISSTESC